MSSVSREWAGFVQCMRHLLLCNKPPQIYWIQTTTVLFTYDPVSQHFGLGSAGVAFSVSCGVSSSLACMQPLTLHLAVGRGRGTEPGTGSASPSKLALAQSPDGGLRVSKSSRRGQYAGTSWVFAGLTFIIVLLDKASHMAKPRVRVEGNWPTVWTQKRKLLWPFLQITYRR